MLGACRTLITTAECLLHENRNPGMSKQEVEAELGRALGIEKVLWLPQGVYADWATNGHVDNFCCFVRPACVLLAWTDDQADPQVGNCVQHCDAACIEEPSRSACVVCADAEQCDV